MAIEAQNDAERLLLEKVKTGEFADVSVPEGEKKKTVRAAFLRDICVRPDHYEVHAHGIWLVGAFIEGSLDLSFATLPLPLLLSECAFNEPLNLLHARAQTISLQGCTVPELIAGGLRVNGYLFLRNTVINGQANLTGADIMGDLSCNEATFKNPKGVAFAADRITVGGNVTLKGSSDEQGNLEKNFSAEGEVRLAGAEITGDLDCQCASFMNPGGIAFIAQALEVKGGLVWREMPAPPEGKVSFHHAKAGQFLDDKKSWPKPGYLKIDGFTYDTFANPTSAEDRLEWLDRMERMEGEEYIPQPYEQVVKVFRDAGHERDARTVAIAKQDSLLKYGDISYLHKLWLWFLGYFIAYGYKPWWAFVWMLIPILAGMALFWHANVQGVMEPSKERVYMSENYRNEKIIPEEYPRFQPLAYSLDVFLPFVDLHQETYWLPNANREPAGGFFRFYLWFHIALGWFLSTIAVVGLTGVLKKD